LTLTPATAPTPACPAAPPVVIGVPILGEMVADVFGFTADTTVVGVDAVLLFAIAAAGVLVAMSNPFYQVFI
jgi:hypothetical protein